jgi:N-acetylglucosamine-6-sulfatase
MLASGPARYPHGLPSVALRGSAAGVVALVACLLALPAPAAAQPGEPPNIVLVVTDDQRWDTLRAMPTVSAELVGKGVTFANAFATNPLCCPSRASILTGTYSHRNGVWSNAGGTHGGMKVFDDRATVATWLDRAGYETMLVGKYLNGYSSNIVPFTYVPPGWDRWLAFFGAPGYFSYRLTDGTRIRRFGPGPVEAEYSTDVLGAEAAGFIRRATAPFFLYFAPFAPHTNSRFSVPPAPRHVNAFAGAAYRPPRSVNEANVSDKPRVIRSRGVLPVRRLTELREEQLESLLAVDEAIAGMLHELEEKGELRNTLFLFTSDNGYSWGEHRWTGKRVPYEESIRVPLVARWDALGVGARRENRLALNIDLAPTIARAAGATVRRRDGRSLLPLLPGGRSSWRSWFLLEYHDPAFFPAYCGTRSRRWKYVQYRNGAEELYQLATDRYELHNLAEKPGYRARLMAGRARVRRSACRPPGRFQPLALCSRTGTNRADTLLGTRWRDWICGRGGRDRIDVSGGNRDLVRCGRGRDVVRIDRRDRTDGCELVRRG